MEGRNRKAHGDTTFRVVWRGDAGKLTAIQLSEVVWRGDAGKLTVSQLLGWYGGAMPLHLRRRRNPHHKPSKFPALNAPERAVVVLCPDKIDFRADALFTASTAQAT
jgi:hypothetical protein